MYKAREKKITDNYTHKFIFFILTKRETQSTAKNKLVCFLFLVFFIPANPGYKMNTLTKKYIQMFPSLRTKATTQKTRFMYVQSFLFCHKNLLYSDIIMKVYNALCERRLVLLFLYLPVNVTTKTFLRFFIKWHISIKTEDLLKENIKYFLWYILFFPQNQAQHTYPKRQLSTVCGCLQRDNL